MTYLRESGKDLHFVINASYHLPGCFWVVLRDEPEQILQPGCCLFGPCYFCHVPIRLLIS